MLTAAVTMAAATTGWAQRTSLPHLPTSTSVPISEIGVPIPLPPCGASRDIENCFETAAITPAATVAGSQALFSAHTDSDSLTASRRTGGARRACNQANSDCSAGGGKADRGGSGPAHRRRLLRPAAAV